MKCFKVGAQQCGRSFTESDSCRTAFVKCALQKPTSKQKKYRTHAVEDAHRGIHRRAALQALGLLPFLPASSQAKVQGKILEVGQGKDFKSLSEAVAASSSGDIIQIDPGIYRERLLIDRSVTLTANQGDVSLEWRTTKPYESVIQCRGAKCEIKGLTVNHSSPSVANNYAILNQGGELRLDSCSVTSATGTGVATEGGHLIVKDSSISNNRGNGVVCVADLSGRPAGCIIKGSRIVRNALNGVVLREDSRLVLRDSAISYNRLYGVQVKGADFNEDGNVYAGNTRGAISQIV